MSEHFRDSKPVSAYFSTLGLENSGDFAGGAYKKWYLTGHRGMPSAGGMVDVVLISVIQMRVFNFLVAVGENSESFVANLHVKDEKNKEVNLTEVILGERPAPILPSPKRQLFFPTFSFDLFE